jgi:multiple sugar transport system substrate-binding protein
MNKKKIAAFLCAALVTLSAILWRVQTPIVLTLGIFTGSNWDVPSPDNLKLIDEAIELFEQENPGIIVKYESGILKEDYSQWLSGKIASGDTPDVFMVLDEDFDLLCASKALKNLDSFDRHDGSFSRDLYYESALLEGIWDDCLYALPMESNPELMFVNVSLLEENGIAVPDENWTLQDLYDICQKLSQNGSNEQFGVTGYTWKHAYDAYGGSLFNASGTSSNLSGSAMLQAISYIRSLDEIYPSALLSQDDFDAGNVAFTPMTFASYRTYKPYPWRIKRLSNFEWTVLPMPSADGIESNYEISSLMLAMSADTPYTQKSWELLKTLCANTQIQTSMLSKWQGISPLVEVDNTAEALEEVDVQLLDSIMKRSSISYHFERYDSALELVSSGVEEIIESDDDISLALMELQKKIDRFLNE